MAGFPSGPRSKGLLSFCAYIAVRSFERLSVPTLELIRLCFVLRALGLRFSCAEGMSKKLVVRMLDGLRVSMCWYFRGSASIHRKASIRFPPLEINA